tara:strand:- start:501 stop:815 length:315 start_codon:yes stop_codon:yes gene_type:complete
MNSVNTNNIWPELLISIYELGYTKKEVENFKLLGANCNPAHKLNKIFLKNKIIPYKSICVCGKTGINKNFYVGLNRNRFIILGSKCYKIFPNKVDFRSQYRNIT